MKQFRSVQIRIQTWACLALGLAIGLAGMAVGCNGGNGGNGGSTGASSGHSSTGGGGTKVSPSGGMARGGAGGSAGSGGATTGQGSGANAGTGAGGMVGLGGIPGSGGSPAGGMPGTGGNTRPGTATGGQAAGGAATGGQSTDGSAGGGGSGGMAGAGGRATGGSGAPSSGGSSGTGGGSGGATTSPSSQGGRAVGGSSGSGGSATGGNTASGGNAGAGGATSGYRPCPSDGSACKIMPFGDSITDGYNADTPGGYRVELFRRAHGDGKNITFVGNGWNGPSTVDGVSFPPRHEGHSGWTIYPAGNRKGISQCLQANPDCLKTGSVMPEYKPDIVLLMIGTNDAIDNYDMANAPKRLGDLIDTIYSQLPAILIVVAQPIPSRGDGTKGDDTALSARLKTYGDAIPAVVKARADAGKHILSVDMYTPFNANKATLIEDQWHPNLQGYVVLGTQWYTVLKPLL